ncbi:hypothetical protein W97_08497 [Coniosporium apollinis CBS 100218]|uniref:RNA polymerase II holoenzyme cyclin-like subunit n=1 Tax=Coniosporium apollinis (strain CBS 100218) TaxID=1168221 RepID=R7Z4Z1_CONA1|nr:uncharacterized protein W97_08497 [Coniosporium apollinis CBS 100218]EON69237.1 hypothetical protein W97_08497 [Coniosporium apollinis CBS 100218]
MAKRKNKKRKRDSVVDRPDGQDVGASSAPPAPPSRSRDRKTDTIENPNLIEVGPRKKVFSLEEILKDTVANSLGSGSLSLSANTSTNGEPEMAPAPPTPAESATPGPHPSFIEVAKPYVFQQKLERCLNAIGMNEAKEDSIRLQGVTWIDNIRRAMQLPVRTYNTAVVYYHKFRLVHSDNEYDNIHAAAAALFMACKIEDTLKKSREILCASWNLKLAPAEHLTPDDPFFDPGSKTLIGYERLMLEAAGFDFRSRHPQRLVLKLCKSLNYPRSTVGKTAYNMSLDLYRTFAPLKQTTATVAIASVELAARLCDADLTRLGTGTGERGIKYRRWGTTRAEVMETLLDLLDLYTHHKPSTLAGPSWPLDSFINIRITLNQEAATNDYPRYTQSATAPATAKEKTKSASAKETNGVARNGAKETTNGTADTSPAAAVLAIGGRGQIGTVRFMLDAARARGEKRTVESYFTAEEEEVEVEVEVERPKRSR